MVLTAWLYYRSAWSVLALSPVCLWYYRNLKKECIERKQTEFLLQFKEMIQGISSALHVGYSIENAVRETQKELLLLYSEDEMITKELEFMVQQIRVNVPAEQVFEEFAERTMLEDVKNFSGVFKAAKRSGGDMIAIIRNTADQIGDKIDVRREIETILAAKQYEFKVMSIVPYGIIAYMTLSFSEFMDKLYGNILGIGVMSGCLCIYTAAYAIGVKLVKIEV